MLYMIYTNSCMDEEKLMMHSNKIRIREMRIEKFDIRQSKCLDQI